MILYLDASSLVAFYLREPVRSEIVSRLKDRADNVALSVLAYPEARAAFARARRDQTREPALSIADYESVVADLNWDWAAYLHVAATDSLLLEAGDNAAIYSLRGYDAVHLTSALRLLRTNVDDLVFSTWDRALATAAGAAGLPMAHEVPR